jgi:hypothetical protein
MIPAQRAPQWPETAAGYRQNPPMQSPPMYGPPPMGPPPGYPPTSYPPIYPPFPPAFDRTAAALAAERSNSKRALLIGAILFLVLAVVGSISLVVLAANRTGTTASHTTASPTTAATPATPFDTASAALATQATALIKGDQAGWLAAVDPGQPALQARYKSMYTDLRGLGVSQFEYHPFIEDSADKAPSAVSVGAEITYCFSMTKCPAYTDSSEWNGAPQIAQSLVLKPVNGHYVIIALKKSDEPNHLQPTPWESGDLVFAQGKRVTVAAPKSEANHLDQVVAIADQAAAVNDRFAVYVHNPQQRYRLYLADDKTWKTWYGGETDQWIVGYTMPLNEAESDVVLRTSTLLGDEELMRTTIQHELGHVVTLGGAQESSSNGNDNLWLIEGIAEYIGWSPRPATDSWRRHSVHALMHSAHPPTTIAAKPLARNASAEAGDAFYGMGHFAVDCMATKFGQRKLFTFIELTLREGYGLAQASQEAYAEPFSTVDKGCVSWIKATA